jgi:hypothetical protein
MWFVCITLCRIRSSCARVFRAAIAVLVVWFQGGYESNTYVLFSVTTLQISRHAVTPLFKHRLSVCLNRLTVHYACAMNRNKATLASGDAQPGNILKTYIAAPFQIVCLSF